MVRMVDCEFVVYAMFVWFPVVDLIIMVRLSFLCQDLVVGFLGETHTQYTHCIHVTVNVNNWSFYRITGHCI